MTVLWAVLQKLYSIEELFSILLHPHSKNPGLKRSFHLEKNISAVKFGMLHVLCDSTLI
jgi:hypothetical protein